MNLLKIQSLLFSLAIFVSLIFLSGCGASAGSGYDAPEIKYKIIEVNEVLAVDDKLVNSNIRFGTGITDYQLNQLEDNQVITTNAEGKASNIYIKVKETEKTLFVEASGGKSANEDLDQSSKFLGVIDLKKDTTTINRININPLSTITALSKAKQPDALVNQLALESIIPFIAVTQIANLDLNSPDYLGDNRAKIETKGDAPLIQLFNEMIKESAKNLAGDKLVDKTSQLLKSLDSGISTSSIYASKNTSFFSNLSVLSKKLSTDIANLDNFFSETVTILSTSNTASVTNIIFVTNSDLIPDSEFKVKNSLLLDDQTFFLEKSTSGVSRIVNQDNGSQLNLDKLPDLIRLERLDANLNYQPELESIFEVKLDIYAIGSEEKEAWVSTTVELAKINAKNEFKLIFPIDAQVSGEIKKANGSYTKASKPNGSEKTYKSLTNTIDFPIKTFLDQAKNAGETLPEVSNKEVSLEIKFRPHVKILVQGHAELIYGIKFERAKIK